MNKSMNKMKARRKLLNSHILLSMVKKVLLQFQCVPNNTRSRPKAPDHSWKGERKFRLKLKNA